MSGDINQFIARPATRGSYHGRTTQNNPPHKQQLTNTQLAKRFRCAGACMLQRRTVGHVPVHQHALAPHHLFDHGRHTLQQLWLVRTGFGQADLPPAGKGAPSRQARHQRRECGCRASVPADTRRKGSVDAAQVLPQSLIPCVSSGQSISAVSHTIA